jgi:hypothetical protein
VEDLKTRTQSFALRIVKLFGALPKTTEAQVIGKQLAAVRNVCWSSLSGRQQGEVQERVCREDRRGIAGVGRVGLLAGPFVISRYRF